MKVSSGWDTKHRVWATRKPKVRSEVPCLENPLGARRMTSKEDIVIDGEAMKRPIKTEALNDSHLNPNGTP